MARAGSSLWLLRHEVRMFLHGVLSTKKGAAKRGLNKTSMAVWVAVALTLHLFAFVLLRKLGDAGAAPPQPLVMGVSALLAAAMTMMLSTGLKSSVEVLFERGDLDLLLSSPLSSRSIFTVRLAGIVTGIAGLYLFFLTPFAHAGLVLGQWRWLAIYPAIVSMAVLMAALAMSMTLGLVRWLGVRRTRVVAQVLGALSGAFIFLLSQMYSSAMSESTDSVLAWAAPMLAPGGLLGPDSLVWLPGRALLGSPAPLLVLSLAAAAVFFGTVHFTHRFFVHGVQQAVSMVRAAPRPPGELRFDFGRGLTRIVVVKEWRLIARDPQLISQVLLQLLYLVPVCALVFARGSAALAGTGAALAFLGGSLAAALAWVIISAEDAPDLLLAAPCGAGPVRRAKLLAVTLPPLVLVALPLLWVLARDLRAGVLMAATVIGSVASAALVALWRGRAVSRSDFKNRTKADFVSNVLEFLSSSAWAGLAYLLLLAAARPARPGPVLLGAAAVFAVALAVLALAWLTRRNRP